MPVILTSIFFIAIVIGLIVSTWRRKQFLCNYKEKSVFITGTDTGFGRTLALALDKKGIKVYAGCYTDNGILSLKKESTTRMKYVKIDVTDETSLLAARDCIEKDLVIDNNRLWGLVNNAGVGATSVFALSTLDNYKMCMNVNFFGALNTTEIFLPLIKKSKGRIVNVTSIARRCHIISEPYTCSKTAMGIYNDGLRRYLKDYGIRVAGIEPGGHSTEMTKISNVVKGIDSDWKNLPENLKIEYGNKYLETLKKDVLAFVDLWSFDRYNHPDTVCDAITHALFSIHPKTSYICGMDANLVSRFGFYLPDFLMDFISRRILSNTSRALKTNLENIQ